jgi:Transmembrane amino acid transporter protein
MEVVEVENDSLEVMDSSLQSLARSWSRAASFSVSPLIPFDQETLRRSCQRPRRASLASSCTTEVEKPSVFGDSKSDFLTWSLLVEDASHIPTRIDQFSGGLSNDAAERLPPAIDETTSLLKGVVPSARKLYLARSSSAQTVFNMINLILGVGILGLPLAFKHAGLLLGLLLFTGSAVVTLWTARIIERCLNHDHAIKSYGDLACAACGPWARVAVTVLVAIELTSASVGQIILFADGVKTLFAGQSDAVWKVICGAAFIPLSFAPLRYLGVSSALSVFCFFISKPESFDLRRSYTLNGLLNSFWNHACVGYSQARRAWITP